MADKAQATAQQALRADVTAVHIGSLGLVVDPMAEDLGTVVRMAIPAQVEDS